MHTGIEKLHETTAARLLWYAATGKVDDARQYVGHILKRGSALGPVRIALADMVGAEFYDAMLDALPWLEDETFGEPRASGAASVAIAPRDRILTMLDDAGRDGLTKSELRAKFSNRAAFDGAIEDLEADGSVASIERGTKGRPARTYWRADIAPVMMTDGGPVLNIDPFEQAQEMLRKARANMGE